MNISELGKKWTRETHNWDDKAFQASFTHRKGNMDIHHMVQWYEDGIYALFITYQDELTGEDMLKPSEYKGSAKRILQLARLATMGFN